MRSDPEQWHGTGQNAARGVTPGRRARGASRSGGDDELQEWRVENSAAPKLRGPVQRAAEAEKAGRLAGLANSPTWVPVARTAHRFVPCFQ